MSALTDQIKSRHKASDEYLVNKRPLWSEYENLFHNRLADSVSGQTKSQVFDPKLSTFVLERSYRVMAQLMMGKVKAISRNDEAASELMNLTLDKYVLPNANAQFDFLTKCRMVCTYSNVYGNFFVMVDQDVRQNGYAGPDMWMIPIRDVFPQVGAMSLDDSDFVIVRSWRPLSYFKNLAKRDSFKNISKVLDKLKDRGGDKEGMDNKNKSERENNSYPDAQASKGDGYFEVLSQYEKDRWVDYVVKADMEIRDMKNPHDDGELPIVNKYSIPLLDDFMAMGDFERGKSMQYTMNSAWNLYLDAVKVSIFPPVLINKDNVASMSSIKYGPAAKWLVKNQINNVAQTLQLSPQGVQTFNNIYQLVNSSLLNMFGTTDTSTSQQTDPGFGKTPKALNMQSERQNSRDVTDRFYMEQFLGKVMKKFVNIMSKSKGKAVQVRMFGEEMDALILRYPEMKEMYDEKSGKLTIDKKKTGSLLYDYEIISGSTYAVDQNKQQENLGMLMDMLSKNPELLARLEAEGQRVNFSEMLKMMMVNSGIQKWDKIIYDKSEETNPEMILQDHAKQFQTALQGSGVQMPGQQGMPTGEIPPQPGIGGTNGQAGAPSQLL